MSFDREIFSEKSNSYRGTVKIELRHFDFDRIIPGVRTIHQSHIDALVNTFESEGCLRLNPDNFVKVLVNDEILQQSLCHQNLRQSDLLQPRVPHFLDLPEDIKLKVIHGKHRLLAAERFLSDKWWIAQLYSDDLPPRTVQVIEEEHPTAQAYCEGDIYRNIRYHENCGDIDAELKWRGRLSQGTRRSLARMEKDFKRLAQGLDKLLPFVGLWKSIKLSYLSRWLSAKCPEELIHYLKRLHRQWTCIMEGYSPDLLDPDTVTSLETLMPECSLHDRARIADMMERREIFPTLESQSDRLRILNRIIRTKGRILSFYTFSRDFIYFEACSTTLQKLLPPKFKRTVSTEFMHSYGVTNQHPGLCRIQTWETAFRHHFGNSSTNRMLAYRQLFLAVMRDFPVLSSLAPYRNNRKLKSGCHGVESESLFKLAWLASELGFETCQVKEILEWASENPDEAVARDFLRQLRPLEWYIVDNGKAEDIASYFGRNLSAMAGPPVSRGQPRFTTHLEIQPKKFRCSRPSFKDYQNDRMFLFIDVMYNYRPVPQTHATSLAIQRDIFVSYFGEYDLPPLLDEPPTENCGSPTNNRVIDLLGNESDQDTVYSMSEEILSRSEDRIDEPGTRVEEASPSFVTASISTATSAQEMRSAILDLDFLSDGVADPHNTTMNEFHYVDDPQPSLVVRQILSEEGVIVVYAWERKVYAKFFTIPEQRSIFEQFACNLADQMQHFLLIRGDHRVYSPQLSSLWDAACRDRLVLVGPKRRRSEPGETLRFLLDRDPYSFIDQTSNM